MSDIDLEQAKTAEEPGTLASLREKHRQSRQVLTGHPNDPALTEPPETPETPPTEPPTETKVEPPKEEAPAITQPEVVKTKFASQEEAERAHSEAERKMHEATTEAAELKKKLEELEKAPPEVTAPSPKTEEIEVEVAKTWEEIDNLDPYDDDYNSNRAKLFTKLLNLRGDTATPATDESARQAARDEYERIRAEEDQRRQQETQEQASRDAAVQIARESGLNMDDKVTERLFWDALTRAPYHEGVTLQEQTNFMVSEVKELIKDKAMEKGAATPESTVLERGSATPVRETASEEESAPRTLGDIKDKWRQQRQI